MALPATSPFSLYIGDDWEFDLTAIDATTSNLIDLTGCVVGAEIFQFPNLVAVPIASGDIVVASPTSGAVSVFVPNAITQNCVAQSSLRTGSPNLTRLHVFYTDALSRRHTIGIIPIIPIKP